MKNADPNSADQPDIDARFARNIPLYCISKGFFGLAFGIVSPIMVLYFLGKQFSLAEFMLLMTAMNVSIFVFEIPTGVVADKFSRKGSVCIGACIEAAAFFIMIRGLSKRPQKMTLRPIHYIINK